MRGGYRGFIDPAEGPSVVAAYPEQRTEIVCLVGFGNAVKMRQSCGSFGFIGKIYGFFSLKRDGIVEGCDNKPVFAESGQPDVPVVKAGVDDCPRCGISLSSVAAYGNNGFTVRVDVPFPEPGCPDDNAPVLCGSDTRLCKVSMLPVGSCDYIGRLSDQMGTVFIFLHFFIFSILDTASSIRESTIAFCDAIAEPKLVVPDHMT